MDNFWKLEEQNTFSTGVQSTKILYQSNLNILLIVTKNGEIVVVDVTTGAELHKSLLTGNFSLLIHYKHNGRWCRDRALYSQVWSAIPALEIILQSLACVSTEMKENANLCTLTTNHRFPNLSYY